MYKICRNLIKYKVRKKIFIYIITIYTLKLCFLYCASIYSFHLDVNDHLSVVLPCVSSGWQTDRWWLCSLAAHQVMWAIRGTSETQQSQVSLQIQLLINKHAATARVHRGRLSRHELSRAPGSFYLLMSRVALVFGDKEGGSALMTQKDAHGWA